MDTIDAVETHISMLFFSPSRVYKLLKPIATGFLDHSDTEARLRAVTAECELNRRLAPDVYLGTSDVVEQGETVDRMLVMRRLPTDRSLSQLVGDGDFEDHLRQVAHTIATFHASLAPVTTHHAMTTAPGLRELWSSSFDDIEPSVGPVIDRAEFDRVRELALHYLDHSEALFERRQRSGFVRDVHGDLTADDVFVLDDGPRILDCIAFDDEYRISDVLADIAFLVMDVERLAGPWPASRLMHWYGEMSGEHHPSSLAHHYVAYRAHVRAKIAILRHRQGDADAAELAVRYHRQAADHLERARRRMVLVGGGPGSGKSTIANGLADRFNWSVIDSDTLRKDLRGVDHDDHRVEEHPDLYSRDATAATYERLCEHADLLLDAGESVVLDATWGAAEHRAMAAEVAERRGAALIELECRVDHELARQRVAERADASDASDATPEVVDQMARRRDPWPGAYPLDTSRPVDESLAEASTLFGYEPAPVDADR